MISDSEILIDFGSEKHDDELICFQTFYKVISDLDFLIDLGSEKHDDPFNSKNFTNSILKGRHFLKHYDENGVLDFVGIDGLSKEGQLQVMI